MMREHLSDATLARYEEIVRENLSEQDDTALWVLTLEILVREIALLEPQSVKHDLFLQIGACSHWLRPHQSRWLADGSFAFPDGYGGGHSVGTLGLPEFDGYLLLWWNRQTQEWDFPIRAPGRKRDLLGRVSIPTRTAIHHQAAISVFWPQGTLSAPGKKTTWYYGFRKRDSEWRCTASHGFPNPYATSR